MYWQKHLASNQVTINSKRSDLKVKYWIHIYLPELDSREARMWTWRSSKSLKFLPIVEFFPSHPPNRLKLRSPCRYNTSYDTDLQAKSDEFNEKTSINDDPQKPTMNRDNRNRSTNSSRQNGLVAWLNPPTRKKQPTQLIINQINNGLQLIVEI